MKEKFIKYWWIFLLAIIIIAVLAYFLFKNKKKESEDSSSSNEDISSPETENKDTSAGIPSKTFPITSKNAVYFEKEIRTVKNYYNKSIDAWNKSNPNNKITKNWSNSKWDLELKQTLRKFKGQKPGKEFISYGLYNSIIKYPDSIVKPN